LNIERPKVIPCGGATPAARIAAAIFTVIFAYVIENLYILSRRTMGGIMDVIAPITVACAALAYCVLVTSGFIHRHKR